MIPASPSLQRCVTFLQDIGLIVRWSETEIDDFLPGVRITNGTLDVSPSCRPSDLLHEAGHLAITPGRWRPLLDGNISTGLRQMGDEWWRLDLDPDDPISRAVIQTSDPEATAWAWAAGRRLGLAPEEIICNEGYGGDGSAVRLQLMQCTPRNGRVTGYVGVHGLAHAGMTALHDRGPLPIYPAMARWLQID